MRISDKVFSGLYITSAVIPGIFVLSGAALKTTGIASLAFTGMTLIAHQFWKKKGKQYLANFITNRVDGALKNQVQATQTALMELLEKQASFVSFDTPFIKTKIDALVKEHLDTYTTNPRVVLNALDDIDLGRPLEKNNIILDKLANQITNHIIAKKLFGFTFLRNPVYRIVSAVADSFLKSSTQVLIKKIEVTLADEELAEAAKIMAKDKFGIDIGQPITDKTVQQIKAFEDSAVGSVLGGAIKRRFGIDLGKVAQANVGKPMNEVTVSKIVETLKK